MPGDLTAYFHRETSAAPLAVFRIGLGILLLASTIRFWAKGWIEELYIAPKFFFQFYGFEFVKPLGEYTYVLFAISAFAALFVAIGLYYRVAAIALFATFTYIELIDKTTYLNHYYFVSMISLLMIFLPANAFFSVDAYRNKKIFSDRIPQWTIDSIKMFVCIVYVYAGLAKINTEWLLEARPLHIWLPAKNDLPLIGWVFNYKAVAFVFSWLGCLYDLTIPFLLWHHRARPIAYAVVIVFHVITSILFPIGMFPLIMILTALIFFSPSFHQRILNCLSRWLKLRSFGGVRFTDPFRNMLRQRAIIGLFLLFFMAQLAIPLRYLFYPGELFWTEEGYRFSWRVMLMEKAGHAQFAVVDKSGKHALVDNQEFLTTLQEKMMSTQPDMILQYASFLKGVYEKRGFVDPQIFADTYVALNGRLGKPLVDPKVDLASMSESFRPKGWILPFEHEIKGF